MQRITKEKRGLLILKISVLDSRLLIEFFYIRVDYLPGLVLTINYVKLLEQFNIALYKRNNKYHVS